MTTKTTLRLWQPPSETIEAIAAVLGAHWKAAVKSQPEGLFWPHPGNWLRQQATRLANQASASASASRDDLLKALNSLRGAGRKSGAA